MVVACPGHITVPQICSARADSSNPADCCFLADVSPYHHRAWYTTQPMVRWSCITFTCLLVSDHKDQDVRAGTQPHIMQQTFLTGFTFELVIITAISYSCNSEILWHFVLCNAGKEKVVWAKSKSNRCSGKSYWLKWEAHLNHRRVKEFLYPA